MKKFGTMCALLALTAAAAWPQAQTAAFGYDPPGRAASLSWIEGAVSFQPGGVEDWVPATLNRPLTTGDRLWTDTGARSELQLGTAAFRLGSRTNFTVLNLTDDVAQIQLSSGTLSVRVRSLMDGEILEIDTPQAAFSLLSPGEYRIDVSEQGDASIVTVRSGEAEITGAGEQCHVQTRQQVRVTEQNGQAFFDSLPMSVPDVFDNWCQARDRREDQSESARYLSHDIPGYADLDGRGVWNEDLQYAWIWFPRVGPDWAPYRFGHWAWIEPWGWTWVDDAAWGYAPFHYGRWVNVRARWGWVPGPIVARPIFCPALVVWVGGLNFGLGISIGGPPLAWFPLGPREVWVPPYRYSPRYLERVNLTNTIIPNRSVFTNPDPNRFSYRNRDIAGGVTAVPRDVLLSGRPVRGAALPMPSGGARGQFRTFPDVAPRREALLDGRTPMGRTPPQRVMDRRVVARTAPPQAPIPFVQREPALRSNPGQPLDRPTENRLRQTAPVPSQPAYRQIQPARPAQPVPARPQTQPATPAPRRQPETAPLPRRMPEARPQSTPQPGGGQITPQPAPTPTQPQAKPGTRLPGRQPETAPLPRRAPEQRPRTGAEQPAAQPTPQATPNRQTPPANRLPAGQQRVGTPTPAPQPEAARPGAQPPSGGQPRGGQSRGAQKKGPLNREPVPDK
ncbi:MAG: FecR domain-containing protein [Acidobacteriota bacterium]|nr:FecR domain-containing protein [Acidobacteriota bacterium]